MCNLLLLGSELVRGFAVIVNCCIPIFSDISCNFSFSFHFPNLVNLLDGVANTGTVELGDVQLAVFLAEKKSSGQPFFRNGENY